MAMQKETGYGLGELSGQVENPVNSLEDKEEQRRSILYTLKHVRSVESDIKNGKFRDPSAGERWFEPVEASVLEIFRKQREQLERELAEL